MTGAPPGAVAGGDGGSASAPPAAGAVSGAGAEVSAGAVAASEGAVARTGAEAGMGSTLSGSDGNPSAAGSTSRGIIGVRRRERRVCVPQRRRPEDHGECQITHIQ